MRDKHLLTQETGQHWLRGTHCLLLTTGVTPATCPLVNCCAHLCAIDWLWAVLKVGAKAVEGAVSCHLGVLQDK